MADWYDTRLSHVNPVDDWDKRRGRLYRLRPEGADRPEAVRPRPTPSAELVELLSHRNEWFRKQAVLEIGWRS